MFVDYENTIIALSVLLLHEMNKVRKSFSIVEKRQQLNHLLILYLFYEKRIQACH